MDSQIDSVRQNLVDAGCGQDWIDQFFQEDSDKAKQKLLDQHRQRLLDEIHAGQKKLDCLDYFIYTMRRNSA